MCARARLIDRTFARFFQVCSITIDPLEEAERLDGPTPSGCHDRFLAVSCAFRQRARSGPGRVICVLCVALAAGGGSCARAPRKRHHRSLSACGHARATGRRLLLQVAHACLSRFVHAGASVSPLSLCRNRVMHTKPLPGHEGPLLKLQVREWPPHDMSVGW